MKFFSVFVNCCLVALVFAAGYASHGMLGDWLKSLVTMDPTQQFVSVFQVSSGILTAALAVSLNVVIFVFVLMVTIAIVQEIYYQLFVRKLPFLLLKALRKEEEPPIREKSPREKSEELERIRREKEFRDAVQFQKKRKKKDVKNVDGDLEDVEQAEGQVQEEAVREHSNSEAQDAGQE